MAHGTTDVLMQGVLGITAGFDEDENRVIKSAVQWGIWPQTGAVSTMVQCREGQEVCNPTTAAESRSTSCAV